MHADMLTHSVHASDVIRKKEKSLQFEQDSYKWNLSDPIFICGRDGLVNCECALQKHGKEG